MKLRNKNTGDSVKFVSIESIYKDKLKLTYILSSGLVNERYYTSIEKFNEDWEDYEPKEPLIKDEKIRKAIRAWAEANEIVTVEYDEYWVSFRRDDKTISFKDEDMRLGFYELENRRDYTIDELCGEGEE